MQWNKLYSKLAAQYAYLHHCSFKDNYSGSKVVDDAITSTQNLLDCAFINDYEF